MIPSLPVLLVAVLLAVGTFGGGWLYIQRLQSDLKLEKNERAITQTALDGQINVNKILRKDQRAREEARKWRKIAEHQAKQRTEVLSANQRRLESNSKKAKEWFDSPIPDDVADLLRNPYTPGGNEGDQAGSGS